MIRYISGLILAVLVLAGDSPVRSQHTQGFNGFELVDKQGNIRKPADYRDRFELLGTYTVIDPKGNQMHVTYASPGTAAYYRKTGKFPDGAVLVKEIYGTDHAQLTTVTHIGPQESKCGSSRSKMKKVATPITNYGVTAGVGRSSRLTPLTSR